MIQKGGFPSRAKSIALTEVRSEKAQKSKETFFLFVALISLSILLLLIIPHLLFTGYALYLESQAGYITEVVIDKAFPTTFWNGVYGLALRVPGFTEQLFEDFSNEIARKDLFFDCMDESAEGGNEVYASNSSTIDFNSLAPGNLSKLDSYVGCNGLVDCPSNTFTGTMWVMLGTNNITNIPSTYTYRWDGQNDIFEIGVLEDALGNYVFVTKKESIQKGYSNNVTVNFQMLLPDLANPTMYFFFTDPFDECPAGGGVGNTFTGNVYGYIFDTNGAPIENASAILGGNTSTTNVAGFFNVSLTVIEGTYSLIGTHPSYLMNFSSVNFSFTNTSFMVNLTLATPATGTNNTITPRIYGYIKDDSGNPLYESTVYMGGFSTSTDLFGYYSFYPTVLPGNNTLFAIKEGYNNNYTIVYLPSNTTSYQVNLSLKVITEETLFRYLTGPYEKNLVSRIREEVLKKGEDYWVSTKSIIKEVRKNTFIEESIGIYNFGTPMTVTFNVPESLRKVVEMSEDSLSIGQNAFGEMKNTIYGTEPLGVYLGNITLTGGVTQTIPTKITIVERRLPIETLLMKVDLTRERVAPGSILKYRLLLQNLLSDQGYMINLNQKITNENGSVIYQQKENNVEIKNSLTLLEEMSIPTDTSNGEYVLSIDAKYFNYITRISVPFKVAKPLYLYSFFGIPLWAYLVFTSFLSFLLLSLFVYKRQQEKKKRYSVSVDFSALPKPGRRVVSLGHVAETNKNAWFEIDKLTTHSIVAGATGMGKSISAQVMIEECLKQNICVIVFDPTAQWSGMLRKCEDKKMLSFYPKFGLKASDARGFPGNIRAVKDARQIVDVSKYFEPGHIQIFTLNKLQPKDMDIFVANTIRQIFKSDPKENPELKMLLVFDEVHRLLPKFGGSGEGFLQIERGCREFRKWGIGQILISQVMNDFVGEIKANINTEVQARTVEEGDLERIKSKYGEGFLRSLVKSEVGVAMFQNADYNIGRPYFINFRPILHNTRRLPDEELEKYNQYNDQVEDLEYQIEQLEELKIDVFDLKMELKLVKDKIMTGNFSVVDIYLEGLKPRIVKQWEKLGKTPKKKQMVLASIEDIQKSVEEARKEREKVKAQEAKEAKAAEQSKTDPQKDFENKIVEPLTFDNGAMISTFKELKDLLPSLDDDVFVSHVNDTKHDIAKWVEQLDSTLAKKLLGIKDKATLVKEITGYKVA